MDTIKSQNILWHHSKIEAEEREKKLKTRGAVVWFTGLSGSGKSTIAHEVEYQIIQQGKNAMVLDGDNIRHGLSADLGFSPEDRKENIRRIGEVAKLFCEANIIALIAFISPYQEDRDRVRRIVPKGRFLEIFCKTPLEVCEKRDSKGLYKKARAVEISNFTGISAPYESPKNPELVLKTAEEGVEESVCRVMDLLIKKEIL